MCDNKRKWWRKHMKLCWKGKRVHDDKMMCEIDGWWNRGEVRDSRELWCGGSKRGTLNKWRFEKRRTGFAIGGSDWDRSRNRSIDDNGAVFLLIRAAGNWLSNMLRHVGLGRIQEEWGGPSFTKFGHGIGSGCCHLGEVHIGNLFCKRSNEDRRVFVDRRGKQGGLWCLEDVWKRFRHMWQEKISLCSSRSFMFRFGWGLEVVCLHFYTCSLDNQNWR